MLWGLHGEKTYDCGDSRTGIFVYIYIYIYIYIYQVLTRFLPGAAAPDSNDGTDVAYTA